MNIVPLVGSSRRQLESSAALSETVYAHAHTHQHGTRGERSAPGIQMPPVSRSHTLWCGRGCGYVLVDIRNSSSPITNQPAMYRRGCGYARLPDPLDQRATFFWVMLWIKGEGFSGVVLWGSQATHILRYSE